MFALHVVRGMQPDMFLEGEWDFLIGLLVEAGTEEGGGRAPSWLEAERGGDTSRLLATLPALGATLQLDEGGIWGAFMKTEAPEKDFPVQVIISLLKNNKRHDVQVGKRLSLFQQLLVVQALRPDRLESAMEHFAQRALGLKVG